MTPATELLAPRDALTLARQLSSIETVGDSAVPLMVVDLRSLDRSFRQHNQDDELARLVTAAPWVNVGVVDDHLDSTFASLADSFDVLIGDGTDSAAAVDTDDVPATLAELHAAVEASPQACVALARLLRTSHDLPISQALHAESLTYAMLQTGQTFQRWLARVPLLPSMMMTRFEQN